MLKPPSSSAGPQSSTSSFQAMCSMAWLRRMAAGLSSDVCSCTLGFSDSNGLPDTGCTMLECCLGMSHSLSCALTRR